jgi:uncharacterized tellurite resistance protein B-like protein
MANVDIDFFKPAPPEKRASENIDNLLSQFNSQANNDWSIPEAVMCLLLSSAVADGVFSPEEQSELTALARRARTLKGLDNNKLAQVNALVRKRLEERPEGVKEACEALPGDMRLSIFAHCVDICLADGVLQQPESDFLNRIAGHMKLSREDATNVLGVMLTKNRY